MSLWMLVLACTEPVDTELRVVDAVHGAVRSEVPITWRSTRPDCTRSATSDPAGAVRASLCPGEAYEVVTEDPALAVWPPVAGPAEALPATLQVVDRPGALALVGGGAVPLPDTVDVRRVRPKGIEGGLAVPAVLPVVLPTWASGQGLFVPEGRTVSAVPVVPTGVLELEEGGPLQPWFALGARVDDAGRHDVPEAAPTGTLEVPGGIVWMGLPPGTYALWDGAAERVPLLKVE